MRKFTTKRVGNYLKVWHSDIPDTPFTISGGNSKVQFPIITFGSALRCVNRMWCPYSIINKARDVNAPKCYAQKLENLRTNVRVARERNEDFVSHIWKTGEYVEFAELIAVEIWFAWGSPFVRFNEGSDLTKETIEILKHIQGVYGAMPEWGNVMPPNILPREAPQLYGYTHHDGRVVEELRDSGIAVMRSDEVFVVYESDEDIARIKSESLKPVVVCPGVCSSNGCHKCALLDNNVVVAVKKH